MKKFLLLLVFFLLIIPLVVNANEEPNRKVRCCQVTDNKGVTWCREKDSICKKERTDDPDGVYKEFDFDSECTANTQPITIDSEFTANTQPITIMHQGRCTGGSEFSNPSNDLEIVGANAGYSNDQRSANAVTNFVGKIIKFVLSLTGLIFLVYTIYSGFQWMTAGGNANRVSEARTRLIQSAIGMAITAIAYSAATLIIRIIGSQS